MIKLLKMLFGFGGGKNISSETREKIARDWANIKVLLDGKSPSQLRQALLTADKTLDNALRDLVPGNTMGERLKSAKDKFDYGTYDRIWKAHKVRNALVHEAGYEPPHYVLTEAIENLRRGLEALGVRL